MKIAALMILVFVFTAPGTAQIGLEQLVETEKEFSRFASEQGSKAAFLKYLSDDGLLFLPDKINGKQYWTARADPVGLLSWHPNFADISANGILGYTTGNWEYRPDGKGTSPGAFGQFVSVWLRQPDGRFKLVTDIGVEHSNPGRFSTDWSRPLDTGRDHNEKNSSAADSANRFYEISSQSGVRKGYETYLADDVRGFRDGVLPIVGRKSFLAHIGKSYAKVTFAKRSVFFGSADLAYVTNTYSARLNDQPEEKGNFLQIWKFRAGRWLIVLDIYKPLPS